MLLNNFRDGNRKSPTADHLTADRKESFACNVQRMIALTTDKTTPPIHLYDIVNSEYRTRISF
jgi:hypothetical protein